MLFGRAAWLRVRAREAGESGTRRMSRCEDHRPGALQGGVISPSLANQYLHLPDRVPERHRLAQRYRARMVRFASAARATPKR